MTIGELFKQYLEHLFCGKRCEARELILAAQDRGIPASKLLHMVIWPAMEQVDKLYRANQIPRLVEHMATRINRMLADMLHLLMARHPKTGQRMVIVCGDGECEELGAQITADLFEAEGWTVWFLGSGVPADEILNFMGKVRPDVLCLHGARPAAVPSVRKLVEMVHEIGIFRDMQVVVSGGVFNRADGLADEIKADLFAPNAQQVLQLVQDNPVRVPRPDVPQPGRRRKRKHKVHPEVRRMKMALAEA